MGGEHAGATIVITALHAEPGVRATAMVISNKPREGGMV